METNNNDQNTRQMSLDKYFQITKNKTQDDCRTIKQENICKEELDLSWQEEDELYANDRNTLLDDSMGINNTLLMDDGTNNTCNSVGKDNFLEKEKFGEIHSLISEKLKENRTLSVMIERLPEQNIKKSILNTENSKPKTKSTVNDRNDKFANLITRFCENCKKIVRSDLKRTSCCPKCECVLVYECKKCSKHRISYPGILYHIRSTCQSEEHYYQCAGCPYKSVFKHRTKSHMQKLHKNLSVSDMKIIATQELQKDPKNSELFLHKCLKCGKQFKHLHYMKNHSRACGDDVMMKYRVEYIDTDMVDNRIHENSKDHLHRSNTNPDILDVITWAKLYCKECDKRFDLKDSIHSSKKCNDCKTALLFECSKCDKQYESSKGILYHMKMKCAIREMYYCTKCDYKNPVKNVLNAHYKNVHESSTVECPQCKSVLKNKRVLVRHLEFCGKEPYLYCDRCPYKSNNPTVFRTHMRRHNYNDKNTEVSCSKCGKKLKNKLSLSSHLSYCGKEQRFHCTMCTYKSYHKKPLREHVIRIHFKNVNKHPDCPKCGVKFENKHCVNAHLRFCGTFVSHLQCDYCPYKSDRKDQLKSHIMRKHLKNNDKSDESDVDVVGLLH